MYFYSCKVIYNIKNTNSYLKYFFAIYIKCVNWKNGGENTKDGLLLLANEYLVYRQTNWISGYITLNY